MLFRSWGARARVQVSRRELHTHIHLDYVRVEFYLVKKKKKKFNSVDNVIMELSLYKQEYCIHF